MFEAAAQQQKNIHCKDGITCWVCMAPSNLTEVSCSPTDMPSVLCVFWPGPVGSGRADVPPSHSCSTSWLSGQRPTLHTSAGHLYQTPTVQMLKITLHRAQGLQNLHVDPHAAAAAAVAISKLSTPGEAPTRAERARIAATAVLGEQGARAHHSAAAFIMYYKVCKSCILLSACR